MNQLILAVGLSGQFFYSGRILAQWLASEKENQSVVPMSFWILSLLGSIFLLIYAYLREDPVFFIGQIFGLGVYLRNIQLIQKRKVL
ncbi:MAG: lipid-A-disaccharide synthase N-terminal domain-containing protein [Bacteriovoracaceae bacterium]